jgi:bifunctional oligoribonuclease and PAP phosphatase NrnA
VLLSHVRPDGDAIGSQLALGFALLAMGKSVRMINEDGLPENLAFLPVPSASSRRRPSRWMSKWPSRWTPPPSRASARPRCTPHPRPKLWLNIDHHISNPKYGDLNLIDATSPATGEILYDLITALDLPLPPETRDAIYVAVSTDTGSFQYPSTTARTYEMAADLVRRGLDVGTINSQDLRRTIPTAASS